MSTVETQTPPAAPAAWNPNVSPRASDPRRKNPFLAGLLSIMPGLGQIYVGYYRRGFVHAIVVGTLITLLASNGVRGLEPMFGIFLAFFWMYNVIDAGRRAALYNFALDGVARIDLPEDLVMPGMRGSMAGGLILIGVGAVLLSNTLFGYSLRWLEHYWPIAPIVLGVYLVGKGWLEAAAGRSAPR